MDILLDPRNKPAKEFFIFLKIQDGCQWSNILGSKMTYYQKDLIQTIWAKLVMDVLLYPKNKVVEEFLNFLKGDGWIRNFHIGSQDLQ